MLGSIAVIVEMIMACWARCPRFRHVEWISNSSRILMGEWERPCFVVECAIREDFRRYPRRLGPTSMPFISLTNYNVSLGRNHVLQDLDVEVPSGAVGLLGPNGAGKSTLVRSLLGFVKPTSGEARMMDLSVATHGTEIRERVGYMPEHDSEIPGMSAVAFVAYMGRLAGLPRRDALERAHEVLHHSGLGEARYRDVETYSAGMKQRLKLAQALVHDPDVLFLDEPTNGLDPDGRKDMLEMIRDVSQEKGKNVLLSSHILPDVEYVCEHVVVIDRGRIVEAGSLDELKTFHHVAYEVRAKGDGSAFESALKARELRVEPEPTTEGVSVWRGRITMPDGRADANMILEAAHTAGVQVRNLVRKELTLEEIFKAALVRGNGQPESQETPHAHR